MEMNGIIGLVLSGLALLLNIVGLAIPFWWYASVGDVTSNTGLWQSCVSVGETSECNSITESTLDGKFKATRAFELLGMIGMAVAIVCVLLKLLMMKENEMMPKIAGATAILSGIFMIIGAIIFATIDRFGVLDLHAGFALCIVAGVLALPAGVLDFLNK